MESNISTRIEKDNISRAQADWNWTRIAAVTVVALLLLAVIVAFVFAILPPYTASGDVGP